MPKRLQLGGEISSLSEAQRDNSIEENQETTRTRSLRFMHAGQELVTVLSLRLPVTSFSNC